MRAADAINVADLRALASRRLPRVVFDYLDGGAEDETTLDWNRAAFRRWALVPRVLPGTERSTLPVPGRTRGTRAHRRKAARFQSRVVSSSAPPSR